MLTSSSNVAPLWCCFEGVEIAAARRFLDIQYPGAALGPTFVDRPPRIRKMTYSGQRLFRGESGVARQFDEVDKGADGVHAAGR
jgi:hypothetical protein